jgi:hypothetical protein
MQDYISAVTAKRITVTKERDTPVGEDNLKSIGPHFCVSKE